MALAILNTAILTGDGNYTLWTVSLAEAQQLLAKHGGEVNSAVGHESTAQILTELLGVEVPVSRQLYAQAAGESVLVFKLRGRAPEGVILTSEQVEEIGYDLKVLTRTQ